MESYIKPGCIILTLYLSMPVFAWDRVSAFLLSTYTWIINFYWQYHCVLQLQANLLNYVNALVKDADKGFWGNGRLLVCADRQMASYKDGKSCSFLWVNDQYHNSIFFAIMYDNVLFILHSFLIFREDSSLQNFGGLECTRIDICDSCCSCCRARDLSSIEGYKLDSSWYQVCELVF